MSSQARVVKAAWSRASDRSAALLAAGVAFYTFLSIFPAMIAAVLSYGLLASPEAVDRQSEQIAEAMPSDAAQIVTDQMDALTSTDPNSLGIGLLLAITLGLYGASAGVSNLLHAMRSMFDNAKQPKFVRGKVESVVVTAGALVVGLFLIALVAAAPAVLDALGLPTAIRAGIEAARWLLLALVLYAAISTLLRIAISTQDPPKISLRRPAIVATILWIVVSVGFSLYVDLFGSYAKTYGALAGVVALLMWLWIGLFALILGASIAAVMQHRARDAGLVEHGPHSEAEGTEPTPATAPE